MNSAIAFVSVVAILSVFIPTWTGAFPRDSGVIQADELRPINENDCNNYKIEKKPALEEKSSSDGYLDTPVKQPEDSDSAVKSLPTGDDVPLIPGFISCQYEEATEDPACQQHCLPKGYSYGLCVGNKCSCV